MSYSNASGGTLTLPSPTHVHHVDVGSAVRSLRRSLSRSPSKFKLTGRASPTPDSSNARHSPTPPSGRFEIPPTSTAGSDQEQPTSISLFSTPQPTGATPFKPTVKLSVRSLRSKPVTRPLSRTRVSPKSPLKRVFGPSPDSGNPLPSSASAPEPRGQENHSFRDFALGLSPVSRRSPQKPTRHSMHLDVSGSSKNGLSKFIDANTEPFPAISISPLKRSDANMSVDQTNLGSPVAKRRSLHGISSLDTDFSNIFDPPATTPQPFDIHEDSNQEYQLTNTPPGSPFRESAATPTPSAMPKRASSLRRSTLQQRHGDTRISSFGRRAGEKQLAQLSNEAVTPLFRSRPRLSLDQYLPPDERGSPFSPQAPLPNPSIHPIPRAANQPHPLSRTITQSSSNSSLPDDSPTHLPVHFGERPRVPINFSKSLPVGSRPPAHDSESVATPEYKRAKPFQAAFMSTGLVSKMNRNPELGPPKHPGAKITTMPDTPCKKQPYNSATYPPNLGSGGRSGGRRRSRPSFGSPSTPFGSVTGQAGGSTFGNMDKPGSLFFQQIRAGHTRKSSLLALDDEQGDSADMGDDFPPTPTKNLFFRSISTPQGAQTPPSSRTYALPNSTFKSGTEPSPLESGSKSLTPQDALSNGGREEGDQPVKATIHPFTPNVGGSPRMSRSLPCFALRRSRGDLFATPAPVKTIPTLSSFDDTEMDEEGQTDPEVSASPLNVAEYVESTTPRTPQDSMDAMAPPDPSRLSISNSQDDNGRFARPPATPTTHARQLFPSFAERRASLSFTPQNGHGPKDVDESLSIRFDKSEIIGRGEFSQVFRVSNYSSSSYVSAFSTTPSRRTPPGPESEQVYAVKRIRIGSTGTRERELKLREVAILKALSNSDRVVRYFDSWEQSGYLYIQTEYCTEGSLDNFLKEVGQTGRLDDFRIWKIMVEASQVSAPIPVTRFSKLTNS